MTPKDQDDQRRGWHVGREVPLALVGAIVFQTFFFIWWFSAFQGVTTNRLDNLEIAQKVVSVLPERMAKQEAQMESAVAMLKDIKNDVRDLTSRRSGK